ncbi:MAG: extracellular solute-binding protein [Chloroflexota bacterium]|nr:extracellular solute-binding protein [Chloroflexota bacterium]
MSDIRVSECVGSELSRRDALRVLGAGGTAAWLAMHGEAVAASQAEASPVQIPDSGAQLPTDPVDFHWMDSGDAKALFFNAYFSAYMQAHPNITVRYETFPFAQLGETITAGVQNGNAPDVFQLPGSIPAPEVIREGWVAAIDDLIPDFEAWKSVFPPGSFFEGFNQYEGKTYSFPITKSTGYTTLTYSNTAYMQAAGFDPSMPLTLDEFRAACRKITEQGEGNYFGLMIGAKEGAQLAAFVERLAWMDTIASDFDWRTGTWNYTSDQYLATIELLLALKADGSIFPGASSMNAPQTRAQFPQGQAGILLDGTYAIPGWRKDNPEFDFGVAGQPTPNSGNITPTSRGLGVTGSNLMWMYAESENKAIAGDMFHYIGSPEGNAAFTRLSGGGQPSIYPENNEDPSIDPRSQLALRIVNDQTRLGPMPEIRNPEVSRVNLESRALTPTIAEVIQGIFVGQISDPRAAMQDLADRSQRELERSIKAAQDKGAQVSFDDWIFPNWDPAQDYTEDDYAALR